MALSAIMQPDPYGPLCWNAALSLVALALLKHTPEPAILEVTDRTALQETHDVFERLASVSKHAMTLEDIISPIERGQSALSTFVAIERSVPEESPLPDFPEAASAFQRIMRALDSAAGLDTKDLEVAKDACAFLFDALDSQRPGPIHRQHS